LEAYKDLVNRPKNGGRGDRGENIEKTDLNSNSRLNNLPPKDAYIVEEW